MKKFILKTLLEFTFKLDEINKRSQQTMAKLDDVKAAVAAISEAATAEKLEVQTKLDAVSAQISDLAAQIAEGASGEQLDEVVASLQAAANDVSNIFTPDAAAPVVEEPVAEVPVETPVEEPTGELPSDVEPAPVVDEPVAEVPAEEVPAETPVEGEVPAEAPADEVPADPLVVEPQPILP